MQYSAIEPVGKTVSERMFEGYLGDHGLSYEFEPSLEGKEKRPDYLVSHAGKRYLFEVKERRAKPWPDGARDFNPYKPLRKIIHAGRLKFQEFSGWSCSVVAYNDGDPDMREYPDIVFGAMLGDLGMRFASDGRPNNVFLASGGKMIDYGRSEYENTTISALIMLSEESIKNREFEELADRRIEERGVETQEQVENIKVELILEGKRSHDSVVRVVVCENPGAKVPLDRSLFVGPFDERWAVEDEKVLQVFAGSRVDEIE